MESPDYSKGVMLALYPDPEKAKELALTHGGAEAPETLHTTLAFIGERGKEGLPASGPIPGLREACEAVSQRKAPQEAQVTGLARFIEGENGTPYVGIIGSHTIHDLQSDLMDELKQRGVPVSDKYAFVPHLTFGYMDKGEEMPDHLADKLPVDLKFNNLVLKDGDGREDFPLLQTPPKVAAFEVQAVLYYRAPGIQTFHIYPEDGSEKTVCGQDLPEVGDIWVEKPPHESICPVCTTWHDRAMRDTMNQDRQDLIAEDKREYVPPMLNDRHEPNHEFKGSIDDIDYFVPRCKCTWTTSIRSAQATENAYTRHFQGLDELGRKELAGPPDRYNETPPETKRWASQDRPTKIAHLSEHGFVTSFGYDDNLDGLHTFLHEAALTDRDKWQKGNQDDPNEVIDKMRETRHDVRMHERGYDQPDAGQCGLVSEENQMNHGWDMADGWYVDHESPVPVMHRGFGDHVWNVTKDGTIVDATHDQFAHEGEPDIAILPPGHPLRVRYHSFCNDDSCHYCTDPLWSPDRAAEVGRTAAVDDLQFHHEYDDSYDSHHLVVTKPGHKSQGTTDYEFEGVDAHGRIEKGSDTVGVLHWYGDGPIEHIEVDPEFQGQGIATKMWQKAREIDPPRQEPDPDDPDEPDNLIHRGILLRGDWSDQGLGWAQSIENRKLGAWLDQVTNPVDHHALPEQEPETDAPKLPPLYEGGYSIWPDDQLEEIQKRPSRPADLLSNPKTGWKNA